MKAFLVWCCRSVYCFGFGFGFREGGAKRKKKTGRRAPAAREGGAPRPLPRMWPAVAQPVATPLVVVVDVALVVVVEGALVLGAAVMAVALLVVAA